MPTEPEVVAELATIRAHMEHTQAAIEGLADNTKEARREGQERMAFVHQRLDSMKTEVTRGLTQLGADHQALKASLSEHRATDAQQFSEHSRAISLIWRILVGAGIAGGAGTGATFIIGG